MVVMAMASYEQMLRGVQGLFAASNNQVARANFNAYVDALLGGSDITGLQAIAYGPLVAADRIDAHVAAQRSDHAADVQHALAALVAAERHRTSARYCVGQQLDLEALRHAQTIDRDGGMPQSRSTNARGIRRT